MSEDIKEIKDTVRKARASWWEDGLVEVMSGAVFVFMAVLIAVFEFLNFHLTVMGKTSRFSILVVFFIPILLLVLAPRVKRGLKCKFVWPKLGYSKPRMSWKSKIVYLLAFIVLIGYVTLTFIWHLKRSSILGSRLMAFFSFVNSYGEAIFIGLFIFLIYFGIYLSANKKRFLITGILGLCAGIIAAPTLTILKPQRDTVLFIIVLGTIGVYSLFTGIPRFLLFRKASEEV